LDTLYNIVFTAYPIGWFATYDKELNYDKLESNPDLYQIGMKNKLFNIYIIWRWYLYAATAGLIIYWNISSVLANMILNSKAEALDLWSIGSSMYTCIVVVVNLKIMFATNTHNWFSVFLLIFSISSYFVVLFLTSSVPSMQTAGQWKVYRSSVYVVTMVLIITACVLVEYGYRSIHHIIEEYIMKFNKVAPRTKKRTESEIKKLVDDSLEEKGGFSVQINNSINNEPQQSHQFVQSDKEDAIEINQKIEKEKLAEVEEPESPFEETFDLPKLESNDADQTIILNKRRRCN